MSAWSGPSYTDGWTVAGYVEERLVGQGASGRVVAAVSEATGQRVAIKYLSPSLVRDPSFMWGFRSEAETLRALDVPQVVQLYDYVEAPGQGAAIVMELVEGVSLHEMISERGPTTAESALAALKGSLLGLAAAHALGIVHRDYKPENVLVDTAGNSKLSDFGVAIKAGDKAPTAGTPLYMAPEQWSGAPSSPATDVYAATAVFYECLTAKPPFSGKLGQLRTQHETAPVPLDGVDESLHPLIASGMAKNPMDRPQSAIAFVAELEAIAAAAYGPDWEEEGRSHLAERAAALLPLLLLRGGTPGSSGNSAANTWFGGGRRMVLSRRVLPVATIAAAIVVAVGVVATAVEMRSHNNNLKGSQVAVITPTFTAQAAVTPPVRSSQCTTSATFAFTGIITATAPGAVSYRWVYSSGKQGPVEHVTFAAAGDTQVAGDTVSTKTAGTGWGEIQLINPAGKTSNQATYKMLCASAAGFAAVASVQPPAFNAGACSTTPPGFTASGSITSPRAATVTYYWALSNGQNSAPAKITFAKAGKMAVAPLTFSPAAAPASGQAVLVVTGPVAIASAPATYSLTCSAATVTTLAKVSPATQAVTSCTAAAPTFTFTGTLTLNQAGTVSYHWHLPSGDGPTRTLTFSGAGTQAVTAAAYQPASDTASGSGSIVVTSPKAVTSNAAAFKLTCGQPLSVATSGAATATIGTAYSATATVTGGKGSYKWAAATGLPPGLTTAASAGKLTISGTPTTAGTYSIKLSVSDGSTPVLTATASLSVTVSATPLTVTGGTLAAGTVNVAYSATVTATGGTGAHTWTAAGLPAGLAICATTGTISGTPTAAGTSTVTVTATDSASPAKTAMGTFTLTINAPPLTLGGGTLAGGQLRVAYSATVTATGGTGTKTYAATGLPGGLAMSSAGTISGTPTASGSFTVTVTVTDSASPAKTAKGTYTIVIAPAVTPTSPTPTTSTSSPPPILT
jgi:serine/threonine-protein kinase